MFAKKTRIYAIALQAVFERALQACVLGQPACVFSAHKFRNQLKCLRNIGCAARRFSKGSFFAIGGTDFDE
jgi:hypothetical protein